MGLFWRPGDAAAFGCLLVIAAMFGAMSHLAYHVLHSRHITPLGPDAPVDRFSEARAVEHIRYLSQEIDGRQEGQPGLQEAAQYIRRQLEALAERAGPALRVDIEENLVSGSFKMKFLRHSLSLGYRNHTNIVMRIQSADSGHSDPSFLINGHFDGPLGSPAAADCGSCVASMLELARLIIDSNWIPPHPLVFLFNGAEELFLLGAHGFLTTHKYVANIGAFINIEASGSGGPDLVCQSGPGSWPSLIYAKSAVHPMGQSAAQDVFGIIPGDTDYRIFAQDFGNIPGLDIIFVLGGYFYHTSYDTVDRLLPGSIQARGENIYNLIKAFTSSPVLQIAQQRPLSVENEAKDERAVYFDYLSWFMIFYSRRVSRIVHSMPAIIFFLLPLFLHFRNVTCHLWYATFLDLIKGMIIHTFGIILAVALPVVFAVFRLLFSDRAMTWFAHPYIAFLMFVPCSVVGLLTPRALCGIFPLSQISSVNKTTKELFEEACFWGAFGVYGFVTLAYLIAGLGGGFLACWLSLSMIVAWLFYRMTYKHFGHHSLRSFAGYVIPLIPTLTYAVYFSGFFVQFVIEKTGMMGALPQPYGYFVPDILVAAIVGIATALCMGPLVPVASHWLARLSVIQLLLQVTVVILALSSQFFPYSRDAPKRVVLQHTFLTTDANTVVESSYGFSVVDANSLFFLFKHAPDASELLQIDHQATSESFTYSDQSSWVALFPVSFLFSGSLKFPDQNANIFSQYRFLPQLSMVEMVQNSEGGSRKIHLELYLGSLQEIWVTVLNITGPLSNWSFSDNKLPAPEAINGGPPSYICRLSGVSSENWTFWVEASTSDPLRIDVAVLDQYLLDSTKKLKNAFPDWADLVSFSSFLSSYYF